MTSQELLKLLQQDAEKKAKTDDVQRDTYCDSAFTARHAYKKGHASLHSDICALVDALEFYRNENNWIKGSEEAFSHIIADTGTKAKEALQKFYSKLEGSK